METLATPGLSCENGSGFVINGVTSNHLKGDSVMHLCVCICVCVTLKKKSGFSEWLVS